MPVARVARAACVLVLEGEALRGRRRRGRARLAAVVVRWFGVWGCGGLVWLGCGRFWRRSIVELLLGCLPAGGLSGAMLVLACLLLWSWSGELVLSACIPCRSRRAATLLLDGAGNERAEGLGMKSALVGRIKMNVSDCCEVCLSNCS